MNRESIIRLIGSMALAVALTTLPWNAIAQTSDSGQPIAKRIGTIKAIDASHMMLATSSGPEVAVTVESSARILRLAPGDTNLKNATPVQLGDLQTGDTVRVRGTASDDGRSFSALEVIVITRAAVAAAGDQVRQDWQNRGMGGRVESVDPANNNVTIIVPSLTAKRSVVIHSSKNTLVHRYAPDSA